jgi:histidyl-tRNA synthetase
VPGLSERFRAPRGFRDFPPELMILRRSVISRVISVFERYGFDPIDTPAVEYWETLAGKYGEEAESRLIWRFTDPWSGREYALRYDLTVPLARFIASRRDIPLPFKRYHVGPVWRHEEPQRARYREFYQCDADIVGSPYPEADAEILNLTVDALRELGFTEFKVRVNDRRLLSGVFEEELGVGNPLPLYRVIDKLDKIGLEGVRRELLKLGLGDQLVERILSIIEHRGPVEHLESICLKYSTSQRVREACTHLEEVFDLLGKPEHVIFDMSLVRGLDYYTGPILEAVLDKPNIGSVAGGGRYDNLIGLFTGTDIPATGVSLGIERIIDAGLELGIFSMERKTVTEVQVVVLDWTLLKQAWRITRMMREAGLKTRIDLARSSEEAQRRKARRLNIPILAFIGKAEAETGTITVYNTVTGERIVVKLEEAVEAIKRMLRETP